jgi:molecular chaperone GrpE
MTRRTRADERAAEIDISPAALVKQIEALTAERDAAVADKDTALAEKDEFVLALQRERAEFTNFKSRTARERAEERGLAGVDLITKVLGLADDFDLAIENRPAALVGDAWADGIAAIDRKLRQLLESEGVSAIEVAQGMPFDPREHEAIASVPGSGLPEGLIVGEIRRGYRLRDRVIRPALVAVAAGDDTGAGPAN